MSSSSPPSNPFNILPSLSPPPAAAAAPPAEVESVREPDIKIILLGDSAVGKSKLVERFLMNDYVPLQMSTYALTVFRHRLQHPDQPNTTMEIDFWDTAGQERFSSMHPSYYHRAHACILVFDVTRKLTYQHLEDWFKELQTYRPGLPTLIVANKIDVDYAVVKKSFAFPSKHSHCAPNVYFCSAADGTNVVKLFEDAIKFGLRYKADPNEEDFTEEVMSVIEYFDKKEKEGKKEDKKP